jgi:hypothetical protein
MFITWTSHQLMRKERQHISERLARSLKRRRTRAKRMKERNISSSWTRVWLVYSQFSRVSPVSISVVVIVILFILFMSVVLIRSKSGYGRTGLVSHGGSPVLPLVYFRKCNSGTSSLVSFLVDQGVPLFCIIIPL